MEEKKVAGNGEIHLTEVWGRLDTICGRLWQEDKVAAVSLQALIEEFRGEIARAEQMMTSYQKALTEQRQTLETVLGTRHHQETAKLQELLKGKEREILEMDQTLRTEHSEIERLKKSLELGDGWKTRVDALEAKNSQLRKLVDVKEQDIVAIRDEMIRRDADQDQKHAAKMKELYDELQKKELTTETFWGKQRQEWEAEHQDKVTTLQEKEKAAGERSKFLEKDYQEKVGELQKKYEALLENLKVRATNLEHEHNRKEADLLAAYGKLKEDMEGKETKLLQTEEALNHKEQELASRQHSLEDDFRKRAEHYEHLKENLQAEVRRIVQEYRAKKES